MASPEIFISYGFEGSFFLCFDYYAPTEAKLWYKFSLDPFDIDFLKFRKVDYGIMKNDTSIKFSTDVIFKYLHVCRECFMEKNINFLTEIFFQGGKTSNAIKRIDKKVKAPKGVTKEEYFGKLNVNRAYRLKSRFTNKIKQWLYRIFLEYNFLDNSIEYIHDYYDKWVILVSIIQDRTENVTEELWKFIYKHEIHNFDQFIIEWNKVISREIKINLPFRDIVIFNNIVQILYREKHRE